MPDIGRREFLKYALAGLFGLALPPLSPAEAEALEVAVPRVRKTFLHFVENERRKATRLIVIHHAGFPGADRDETALGIHRLHREKNKWLGIGYHYLIRKDGTIEEGRKIDMVGAHTLKNNRESVGICLAGNFDIGRPTREQMESAKVLVAWLSSVYGLDPTKKGVIAGHRDLSDTSCPGESLYRRLDGIRDYSSERLLRMAV